MKPKPTTMFRWSKPRMGLIFAIIFAGMLFVLRPSIETAVAHDIPAPGQIEVLVFSQTAGFRHASIPTAQTMLQTAATERGWNITFTEDSTAFTTSNLAQYDVVVWLMTTGDVLDATQQAAFEGYIQAGGGFAGIHSASDTEYSWPWYGQLVGAYFDSHPAVQDADQTVEATNHLSTSFLPNTWTRNDEWYNFQSNPRTNVNVLMSLDESSYSGGTMGDHPIAWYHEFDGGRAWYTGGGHTDASYTTDELFIAHVIGGIEWAADYNGGWLGPAPQASDFSSVTLATNLDNPMEMDIANDGHIYITTRCGDLKVWSPTTQSVTTTSHVDVRCDLENGLIGIALDPDFDTNRWVYFHYSHPTIDVARISRFVMNNDNSLDMSSEIVMLEWGIQNDQCCHAGGSLQFGPNGNLFFSTGDNTNPFASNGFAPIDERSGRSAWDAQKSSSNTNDLRGKIMRIHPEPDGSYTIPAGNLFAGDSTHRPEIYIMGNRNPFRISVDPANGWLYWGEVGPDANSADANRGPTGYDEVNQAKQAGNYGWPYFAGYNEPYVDYNFDTATSGSPFDVNNVVNDSPNNTGATNLPSPQPAWLRYPHAALMAGPLYRYDNSIDSPTKLPSYYNGHLIYWNYNNSDIFEVEMDSDGSNPVVSDFLSGLGATGSIDMELDPSTHELIILQYGGSDGLYRIQYNGNQQGGGNQPPVVSLTADPIEGDLPLNVNFSSAGTYDPDGESITYAWDFTTDGTVDATTADASYTYTTEGVFNAQLRVTDASGNETIKNVSINAGVNTPVVTFTQPVVDGGFFQWGETVNWQVDVTDVEDGSIGNGISCNDITVELTLGHVTRPTEHEHGVAVANGCSGSFVTDTGGDAEIDDIFHWLVASYTDASGVTGTARIAIQPKRKQAEHWWEMSGIQTETTTDVDGIINIGWINNGDYISLRDINLFNMDSMTFRVASNTSGGTIEARIGSTTGTLVNSVAVPGTGGWQTWTDVSMTIPTSAQSAGKNDLFFVFTGGTGSLFNVNWIEFVGDGIIGPLVPTPTATPPSGTDVVYAVNVGGASYTAVNGTQYEADNYFTGGNTATSSSPVANTTDDTLYQSERYGNNGSTVAYDFPVSNGTYDVLLQFSEGYFTAVGDRVFDAVVEGSLVADDLDLVATVGEDTAYDVLVQAVTVTDGNLDIDFTAVVQNAKANAIVIYDASVTPPTPTPPPPTNTPVPPTATPPASGTNIALNQPASQSSTDYSGVPERAVDGNTSGVWSQGSVTHTNAEAQPWWEVDLGSSQDIANIVLFNRTDNCCTARLANFYVYVSDSSFGTRTDVAQIANEATWSTYHSGTLSGSSIDIAANTNGRYVRVQLSGTTDPLSLAEVQVISGSGSPTATPVPPTATPIPPTATPPPSGPVYAINAGGGAYTAGDGTVFSADSNFTGGSTYTTSAAITNTTDDPLYQSERFGNGGTTVSYDLPVANGTYTVVLKFAEVFWQQAGDRVMNVNIEGALAVGDLDLILATSGRYDAYDITIENVSVTDGNLDLDITPMVENPKISAFVVYQQ